MLNIHTLDLIFPFFVLTYGAIVTLALGFPPLAALAENRLSGPLLAQLKAHRWLALFCLIVGGFWSLENVWFEGTSFHLNL